MDREDGWKRTIMPRPSRTYLKVPLFIPIQLILTDHLIHLLIVELVSHQILCRERLAHRFHLTPVQRLLLSKFLLEYACELPNLIVHCFYVLLVRGLQSWGIGVSHSLCSSIDV